LRGTYFQGGFLGGELRRRILPFLSDFEKQEDKLLCKYNSYSFPK